MIDLLASETKKGKRFFRDKSKMQILKDKQRAMRLRMIGFLICNCMTCFRGNQVNSMFDSDHPSLEDYLPINEMIPLYDLNIDNVM
mmetsp:Transcript_18585/g.26157  ORF Transcript_18585/g.26157 Transcript_18585/m.26157 type:complete len:86 (+) Transcript_18585:504-761(+)